MSEHRIKGEKGPELIKLPSGSTVVLAVFRGAPVSENDHRCICGAPLWRGMCAAPMWRRIAYAYAVPLILFCLLLALGVIK